MDHCGENVFADELGHAGRGGDVAGGQAGKTRRVHVADVAVKSNRLTVAVNQKYHTGGAFDAQTRKHVFDPLELLFVYNDGRFYHETFSLSFLG